MAAATCELPADLKDAQFGEERTEAGVEAYANLDRIQDDVAALRDMEVRAQRCYFDLKKMAAGPDAPPPPPKKRK